MFLFLFQEERPVSQKAMKLFTGAVLRRVRNYALEGRNEDDVSFCGTMDIIHKA